MQVFETQSDQQQDEYQEGYWGHSLKAEELQDPNSGEQEAEDSQRRYSERLHRLQIAADPVTPTGLKQMPLG